MKSSASDFTSIIQKDDSDFNKNNNNYDVYQDEDDDVDVDVDNDYSSDHPHQQQQQQQQRFSFSCSWICYHFGKNWKALVLGQLLSLLLAGQGAVQATLHLNCNLSAPTFTVGITYFFLSFHLIILWKRNSSSPLSLWSLWSQQQQQIKRHGSSTVPLDDDDNDDDNEGITLDETNYKEEEEQQQTYFSSKHEPSSLTTTTSLVSSPYTFFHLFPLHRPWYIYFIMAFLDIEANYVTLLAFRYTTLTSATLFTALAIPSAMTVSKLWLGRHYTWIHLLGATTCMIGVICNVLQDYESDTTNTTNTTNTNPINNSSSLLDTSTSTSTSTTTVLYPHKLTGDLLAILGGIMYGINDCLTEVCVQQNGGTSEYLGTVGFFAFCIAILQSLLVEWDDILEFFGRSTDSNSTCPIGMGWGLYVTSCGLSVLGYAGASHLLVISEAAFYNLSLLTGDLWSVMFSVIAERIIPQPLFFVALIFVVSGVIIYEMAPSPAIISIGTGGDGEKIILSSSSLGGGGKEDYHQPQQQHGQVDNDERSNNRGNNATMIPFHEEIVDENNIELATTGGETAIFT